MFKGAGIYADERRIEALIFSVKRRISNLQAIAKELSILMTTIYLIACRKNIKTKGAQGEKIL